ALVHGFDTFLPERNLSAVVPNNIASARHFQLISEAIAARCRPPVIGYFPREAGLAIPERHLGLHLAEEALGDEKLNALAACVEAHLDLDRLLAISARPKAQGTQARPSRATRARIGVARDKAFCFYYEDNLDLLRELGAELVYFSPLDETTLPPHL